MLTKDSPSELFTFFENLSQSKTEIVKTFDNKVTLL